MFKYKIRIYLGEKSIRSHVTSPLDPKGKPILFMNRYTKYTFVTSTSRIPHETGDEGVLYTGCTYTDGTSWRLSETDACLSLRQVEIVGAYTTHQRVHRGMPLYTTPDGVGLPPSFSADVVEACYPLARVFDQVSIDGECYTYNDQTGGLDLFQDVPDAGLHSEGLEQRRQRAIELYQSGVHHTVICDSLSINYYTYLAYTKAIRPLKLSRKTRNPDPAMLLTA